jgi:hypothetical protein
MTGAALSLGIYLPANAKEAEISMLILLKKPALI